MNSCFAFSIWLVRMQVCHCFRLDDSKRRLWAKAGRFASTGRLPGTGTTWYVSPIHTYSSFLSPIAKKQAEQTNLLFGRENRVDVARGSAYVSISSYTQSHSQVQTVLKFIEKNRQLLLPRRADVLCVSRWCPARDARHRRGSSERPARGLWIDSFVQGLSGPEKRRAKQYR